MNAQVTEMPIKTAEEIRDELAPALAAIAPALIDAVINAEIAAREAEDVHIFRACRSGDFEKTREEHHELNNLKVEMYRLRRTLVDAADRFSALNGAPPILTLVPRRSESLAPAHATATEVPQLTTVQGVNPIKRCSITIGETPAAE
jgi:hypothetical protein